MWFLALKQLLSRKKQSCFVIGGVLLGTAAYVMFSGIMLGFQTYMITRLIDNEAHIHISAKEEDILPHSLDEELFGSNTLVDWKKFPSGRRDYAKINYPSGWFELLEQDPRVVAYSPQFNLQALAQRGTISVSVKIVGVDPYLQSRTTNIDSYISHGKLSDIGKSGNRIILGKQLMLKLGATPNENILLSVANGKPMSFRIVNYFETGSRMTDMSTVYASLADAQNLNGTPSQLTDIAVRLVDVSEAKAVADGYSLYSTDYVQSWDEENQSILGVFNMQTFIRNSIGIAILLVAGFGIYNILNMLVSQKRKEIGILRSMGFTGSDISNLFLYQGMIFGVVGGTLGIFIGYIGCHLASQFQISGGAIPIGNRYIMVSYQSGIYIRAILLAVVSSLIASWVPARSAGLLNPIEIIRSEG